jgi:hypothetical protein
MFGAPERLSAFRARTFPTVHNIHGSTLTVNEKVAGVDCMMR